jgi:hypothetical protein
VPLPNGFPGDYALCLAWLLLGFALLAAFSQFGGSDNLQQTVHRRTYARLLSLNEWLSSQIDKQWNQTTGAEVIPDLEALSGLKRRVDRAYVIQGRLEGRGVLVELGRGSAALHMLAAILTAVSLVFGAPDSEVLIFSKPVFLILLAASVGLFLSIAVLGIRISRGTDL